MRKEMLKTWLDGYFHGPDFPETRARQILLLGEVYVGNMHLTISKKDAVQILSDLLVARSYALATVYKSGRPIPTRVEIGNILIQLPAVNPGQKLIKL